MAAHLNIQGIQGEDQDAGFVNQVKVESWSVSMHNPTTVSSSGGSAATQVVMGELQCTVVFDKASKPFFQSVTKGTHAATGVLSLVKSGANQDKPYLTLTMTQVFITSLSFAGHASDYPSASITMSYDKFTWEYFTQDGKGNVASTGPASWQSTTKTAS